jgi:hypothetical protein
VAAPLAAGSGFAAEEHDTATKTAIAAARGLSIMSSEGVPAGYPAHCAKPNALLAGRKPGQQGSPGGSLLREDWTLRRGAV